VRRSSSGGGWANCHSLPDGVGRGRPRTGVSCTRSRSPASGIPDGGSDDENLVSSCRPCVRSWDWRPGRCRPSFGVTNRSPRRRWSPSLRAGAGDGADLQHRRQLDLSVHDGRRADQCTLNDSIVGSDWDLQLRLSEVVVPTGLIEYSLLRAAPRHWPRLRQRHVGVGSVMACLPRQRRPRGLPLLARSGRPGEGG
jgi:hypothetical protein